MMCIDWLLSAILSTSKFLPAQRKATTTRRSVHIRCLRGETTGSENVAAGYGSLVNLTTGNNNIGVGVNAGKNVEAGSNNIEVGGAGSADESNTIRIGTTQKATFIAGIGSTGVSGSVVEVTAIGQLGAVLSSARYKCNIHDIGDASARLMRLRPVSFRYKNDPFVRLQYGLIAEEVMRVYPELVTYGADGKVQSVRYLELTALLLNQLQKQAKEDVRQALTIKQLHKQDSWLSAQLAGVRAEHAELRALHARYNIDAL
jgi:hypothetical protein